MNWLKIHLVSSKPRSPLRRMKVKPLQSVSHTPHAHKQTGHRFLPQTAELSIIPIQSWKPEPAGHVRKVGVPDAND